MQLPLNGMFMSGECSRERFNTEFHGEFCSCGALDGEASLIVARRAQLVLALLALASFLAA